ncbi:MAG: 50S ribosomal protein L10, partial [Thermoplasmata archaeon]|nr:50S ribosomal protein L10 [Thermoplasmata archaeon]
MAHVIKWKMDRVEELTDAMTSSPVVGIVDIHGIPAKQLSKMRARLRGRVGLLVTKRTLIDMALDKAAESRPGIDGLKEAAEGQVGLVFTEENPFKLFKLMERTKTASPAKGGEEAPNDIVIKAGDTAFKPGPVIREFQNVGIPAAIERGKVVIKKDAVLVKAGEPIPKDLASVLPRLDILPLMLGLDLQAAYEDGIVYQPDVLDVDTDALMGQMSAGAAAAFNLAVYARIFNQATIMPMLAEGKTFAFNLAVETDIMTPETVEPILARANAKAMALASQIPDALTDEL